MDEFLYSAESRQAEPPNRCVVRLTTSSWTNRRGVHFKTSLLFLRKKSSGFNFLEEEAAAIGSDEIISRIVNLNECLDGEYEVVVCNCRRDWETGSVEDYDYRLVKK